MSADEQWEDRLLTASESEIVAMTRPPALELQSSEDLRILLQRLRKAHARARDIGERQQREMRGKAEPHGVKPVQDNLGTMAKAQALHDAIERLDSELGRREAGATGQS